MCSSAIASYTFEIFILLLLVIFIDDILSFKAVRLLFASLHPAASCIRISGDLRFF